MFNTNFTCCFTGHRDIDETVVRPGLESHITKAIDQGYTDFICGMALGLDMLAARIVLECRENFPHIALECAVPCETQAERWSESAQEEYMYLLECADKVEILSKTYTPYCMWQRNQYMIKKSSLVIAYYDGREKGGTYYSVKYARSRGVDIWLV